LGKSRRFYEDLQKLKFVVAIDDATSATVPCDKIKQAQASADFYGSIRVDAVLHGASKT
jgi:hypothetical protein